jgi:hypothetical protein
MYDGLSNDYDIPITASSPNHDYDIPQGSGKKNKNDLQVKLGGIDKKKCQLLHARNF